MNGIDLDRRRSLCGRSVVITQEPCPGLITGLIPVVRYEDRTRCPTDSQGQRVVNLLPEQSP